MSITRLSRCMGMLGYWEVIMVLPLLLAVRVPSRDAEDVRKLCQSKEVPFPLDRNVSDPVQVEGCIGTRISFEGLPADSVCSLHHGVDRIPTLARRTSTVTPPLTATSSGIYTLNCTGSNGSQTVLTLSLHVLKRPSQPWFDFLPEKKNSSPKIKCVSDSYPPATVKWYNSLESSGKEFSENPIKTSHPDIVNKKLMCCATNAIGEECSQLYDYDLSRSGSVEKQEKQEVLLSPGQSLLLRCRTTGPRSELSWYKDGGQVTSKRDNHGGSQMAYFYMKSVTAEQSGTYLCVGETSNASIAVKVLAKEMLSISLDQTNKTISATEALNFCVQANISSHPLPDYCAWETPDGNLVDCGELSWRKGIWTLCGQKRSGEYKLHLEVASRRVTKTMAICVADKPQINCRWLDSIVWCETVSPVPTSVCWRLCQGSNICMKDPQGPLWTYVQHKKVEDVGLFCETRINHSITHAGGSMDQFAQFCLNNSFGFWCSDIQNLRLLPLSSTSPVTSPQSGGSTELKVAILVLLVGVIVIGLLFLYAVRKKPKYESQLQMIQMMGPSDNDYIYINFKDFQYDHKWEFPRENLQLGKELGSGAFGMVVQATAVGIGTLGTSQVAVKMLKEKHQTVEKEALMSELKMMTHVGSHDNIVNLLGACTGTGPIYLIFQFCWYGDLLNYLKNNRERYHKSLTDAFNKDRFSTLYHNLHSTSDSGELQNPVDNYVDMHPPTTGGQENLALLSLTAEGIYKDSEQQLEELRGLTYNDLLSFAHQVAKGMEFLSSKNCIHRDLAARNVLVTKDRLVKIGDFGLARDINNDSNYVVRGNVRLPVKWMAPESIFQGMYTMKSDIWAYGILLWEIFSLGVTPYPGVKVDNKFYSMIERGFQMECPYYAGDSVYRVMCKCWNLEPRDRPAFSKLVAFMEEQLTNMEEKLYHNSVGERSSAYENVSSALMKEEVQAPSTHHDYCQTAE